MKILIVGGTGTIGKAVAKELKPRHELIIAGSKSGDIQVDVTSLTAIKRMYEQVKGLDAVVITTGSVYFGALSEMSEEQFYQGIYHKLMGQVNLVLEGQHYLNPEGSFTLTSGILSEDPIRMGASASAVNSAIEGFIKSAALELPHRIRINAISPTVIAESMPDYAPFFRGYAPITAAKAALAYSKSVEGAQTGQVYRVW